MPLQWPPLFLHTSCHFSLQKGSDSPQQRTTSKTSPSFLPGLILSMPQNNFCATSSEEHKRSYFLPGATKFNFVSIGSELGSNKSSPKGYLLLHYHRRCPGMFIWTCSMFLIGCGTSNYHVTWMGKCGTLWARPRQYQRKLTVKWKAVDSQNEQGTGTDLHCQSMKTAETQLIILNMFLEGSYLLKQSGLQMLIKITILSKLTNNRKCTDSDIYFFLKVDAEKLA